MSIETKDVMVKINGQTFRCDCGCNVFHKEFDTTDKTLLDEYDTPLTHFYRCNGCNARFIGESKDGK